MSFDGGGKAATPRASLNMLCGNPSMADTEERPEAAPATSKPAGPWWEVDDACHWSGPPVPTAGPSQVRRSRRPRRSRRSRRSRLPTPPVIPMSPLSRHRQLTLLTPLTPPPPPLSQEEEPFMITTVKTLFQDYGLQPWEGTQWMGPQLIEIAAAAGAYTRPLFSST